jgi:hypothetical protein
MTIEISNPDVEALIRRHLQSGRFQDAGELLANALDALGAPTAQNESKARNLVEVFEPIRGLFADGELDFSRSPSTGRTVDLS